MLLHSTTLTIASVGLIPVIITGSISLSTGSIFGLSGLAVVMFTETYGPLIGLIGGILVAAAVGSIDGLLFVKLKIPSFILTLGTMTLIRGLILLWGQGRSIYFSPHFAVIGSFPIIFYISSTIVVISYIIYNFMPYGRYLRAVGHNEEASKLAGISVNKIKFSAFLWCGIFVGISGILSTYRMWAATPTMGVGYELKIIAASVLGGVPLTGGIGRMEGALMGALVMSVLENGLIMIGVGPEVHMILMGLIVIIAVTTMLNRRMIKSIK
ncbi:MAG: ABC transporter permease [Candidatus Bathyarchaeota archaeon]|nr:ABC transporter permease [Candidatus Bathyarchaeota archaeon]